ncbi:MAG: YggU family protein [Deltaproteobacteria bacterium]|nr:YggU family protein [Deltaproteobacteria bacterium]PWB62121.1 MAG: YggU family protein [Deltaproteobacteria bacterium]
MPGPIAAGRAASPATLEVRVVPRSSKEEVAGLVEGAIRVKLTAPAVENRANDALVRFLSRVLDVPRRQVEVVAGMRGRRKIVRIHGATKQDVFRRLGLEQPPD